MVALALYALILTPSAAETLPIDAVMARYEEAIPKLKEIEATTEAEIGRLGPPERGWTTSGMSAAAAIASASGRVGNDVLGEWEMGGHGVHSSGDRPLSLPAGLHRYTVRQYKGPIDYHTYHRLSGISADIVIHTYGSVVKVGEAECQRIRGIELISREPWRDWSSQTALVAFGMARATRDDSRIYCILYRPAEDGKFWQVAYTSEGQPYVALNEDRQAFAPTSHADAAARIFGSGSPPDSPH